MHSTEDKHHSFFSTCPHPVHSFAHTSDLWGGQVLIVDSEDSGLPPKGVCPFLCPRTLFLLRWVPSTAKPSSVGTNFFSTATFCAQKCNFPSDGYRLRENSLSWAQIYSLQPLSVPKNARHAKMGIVSNKTFFPGHKYLSRPFPSSLGTNILTSRHSLKGQSMWLCHILLQFLPHNLLQNPT